MASASGPLWAASQDRMPSAEVCPASRSPRSRRVLAIPEKGWLLVPPKTARTGGPAGKMRVPEPWIWRKNYSSGFSQARASGAGRASILARSG